MGETLKSKKLLKQGVIQGKTIALADDLLTQCNNKQHTEQIIGELEELQIQGLHLNNNKSVIIGKNVTYNSHWVFPIVVDNVEGCINTFRKRNIDATYKLSSLIAFNNYNNKENLSYYFNNSKVVFIQYFFIFLS